MKTFTIQFLSFPGLDATCKLCDGRIRDNQEEVTVPIVFFDREYQGPICETCYKDLPQRVNASRLQKFGG